jgi:hypothetical protein
MQCIVLSVGLAVSSLKPINTRPAVAEAAAPRHVIVVSKTYRAPRNRLLFQWDRRDVPRRPIPQR